MVNHEFSYPVFIAKGVATSGHVADIKPLVVGLYDRRTSSVTTGSGNGKEIFLASGTSHTRDSLTKFYKGMQKWRASEYFKLKDIISFEKAYPQRPENEEWTIGYGGGADDTSLSFKAGETYQLKLRLYGEPIFGLFNKSLEKVFTLEPECTVTECDGGCEAENLEVKKQVNRWVDIMNSDPEMKEFKVKFQGVFSDYVATAPTAHSYTLSVCDSGDAEALQDVQRAYTDWKKISRLSRSNGISTYVFDCQTALPAAFTPLASVALAECGVCPAGYTTVPARDIYLVSRPLAGTEALTTAAAKQTFANTIGTAYGALAPSVFVSQNGAVANIKISFAEGTAAPAALLADSVAPLGTVQALCTPVAATPVAWVEKDPFYTIERTLRVTVSNEDCENLPTVADVEESLSQYPSVIEFTDVSAAGDICVKVFQITQVSECMEDACQSPDVATFENLPSFQGVEWKEQEVDAPYDPAIKAGIRISAPFYSNKFSDFSYDSTEYWDSEPIRMEVAIWNQDGDPCIFGTLANPRRVKQPKYQRLYGESVLRTYIKGSKYFKYEDWSNDQRFREVVDSTHLSQVKRDAYYIAYYLKFKAFKGDINFFVEGEYFEPVIFVEEGDLATQLALETAIQAVTSKNDVYLENRINRI